MEMLNTYSNTATGSSLPKTLWELLREIAREQGQMPPIQAVPRTGSMPLSFAQERLNALHQFEVENLVYNISITRRLSGVLNIAALEQGINEIIRRHEVLRTTLPAQQVLPVQAWKLPVIDCQSCEDPENEARRHIKKETQKPFDLHNGPSFLRGFLFQIDSQEYIILILTHQAFWDDQSSGILMKELSLVYNSFSSGKPSRLPDPPVQYIDFAYWQRQVLQGDVLDRHWAYWKTKLHGRLPRLSLSAPRHNNSVVDPIEISSHFFGDIKKISQRAEMTLPMFLLAAFKTLLFRCTDQEDMLVFSSFGGRNRTEVKHLIGLFANVLILRTDMSGNPSFIELLSRVRETMYGALLHQDMPFDKLLENLYSETGQTPAFQVLFVFQNTAMPDLCLSGLKTDSFKVDTEETNQFDLILYCKETAQGLTGWIKYREGLCEAAPYLAETFQNLLKEIAVDPEKKLSELPAPPITITPKNFQQLPNPPLNPTNFELQLINIWKEILQLDFIGIEDNFFDVGGNSLLALKLLANIEKIFGCKLPVASLIKAPTVREQAQLIKGGVCHLPRLVPVQPRGERPPFFYIPAAANTALGAVKYASYLRKDQPVYGLQPLGFEEGEEPHNQVKEMVVCYLKEVQNIQPEGPYYLGGHCFGCVVAFEMAQQLLTQGHEVGMLALFDQVLPVKSPGRILMIQLKNFIFDKLDNLAAKLNGGSLSQSRRIQRVMRSHWEARMKYEPQNYRGKITLFQSTEYQTIEQKNIRMKRWSDLALGGFECYVIQGDHMEIFHEPQFQQIAEKFRECLEEAQAQYSLTACNHNVERILCG